MFFYSKKRFFENEEGKYIKLSDFRGVENQPIKTLEAISGNVSYFYSTNQTNFNKILGSPIAYWVSDRVKEIFDIGSALEKYAKPIVGLFTCNNELFLKGWSEIEFNKIDRNSFSSEEASNKGLKWFPYKKGGGFQKWYGNNEYVVNFENDASEIRDERLKKGQSYSLPGYENYFKLGITWSDVSSSKFACRLSEGGFIFDIKGSSCFPNKNEINYIMSFLNSKFVFFY